jgi:hypothetical protein
VVGEVSRLKSRPLLKGLAVVLAGSIFFLALWVGMLTRRSTRGIAELDRVLAPHLASRHSELGGGVGKAYFERYYGYVVKLPLNQTREMLERDLRAQGWSFAPVLLNNHLYLGSKVTPSGTIFEVVIDSKDRKTTSIMVVDTATHYSPLEAKVLSMIGLG